MIISEECPWSSSERQQIKLLLKLIKNEYDKHLVLDKKWIAKLTKMLPHNLYDSMTLIWLTKQKN
jgi:hypothetical protein